MNEPIGCALCGGNNHNADECKRFAEWMAVPELGKFIDWVWQLKQGRDALLAAQPAPVVPEGWRVFLSTADCLRDGDRWEVYGPKGGGIVSTHDVRDWAVRELLDALAAAPAQGQQVEWRTTAVMLEQANAGLAQLNGKLRIELTALKAQQVGQEPVAWRMWNGKTWRFCYSDLHGKRGWEALYTSPQPAPAQDVAEDWSVFIGYLIDKCEGHEISEERLQFWLRDMLDDPHYGALFRREKELAEQPSAIALSIEAAEEEHGSLRAAAKALDVDHGYLSRLKNGDKSNPSDELLAKLGLERLVIYRTAAHDKQSGVE